MIFEILSDESEFSMLAETSCEDEALGSRKPALIVVVTVGRTVMRDFMYEKFLEGAPFIMTGGVHRIDESKDTRLPRLVESHTSQCIIGSLGHWRVLATADIRPLASSRDRRPS